MSLPQVGVSSFTIAMGRLINIVGSMGGIAKRYYALYMSCVDCEEEGENTKLGFFDIFLFSFSFIL